MMRSFSLSALAVSMFASLVSAEINFDGLRPADLKAELAAAAVPAPSAPGAEAAPAEWTIMVFVNGKNNLERYALKDMNEMEMVGSTDKLNIVVEVGRIEGYDTSDGDWTGVRRYRIEKDADPSTVSSPVLADLGKVDMGDYRNMVDFAKWAKAAYPAKKYMFIAWNHGSGWDKDLRAGISKGISYDDETGNHVSTPQLGKALAGMGKVDVYSSDACLMQMAEVVYELKDSVYYIVGSEETEPGDGYTYNDFLAPVAADPGMSAEELGKTAVDAYSDHYLAMNKKSTQSLLKTAALPQFLTLMNDFAATMMKYKEQKLVKKAVEGAQSYEVSDNHDIWHFAGLVAAGTKKADVRAKAGALQKYIGDTLIVHNRAVTDYYANSHGIAGYMPASSFNPDYYELAWAGASKWDEFIKWYMK